MKNLLITLSSFLLLFAGCSGNNANEPTEKIFTVVIGSEKFIDVDAYHKETGYAEKYFYKLPDSAAWKTKNYIKDFRYECGYEYNILVKETEALAGTSDYPAGVWTCMEVIGKEQKQSIDLPQEIFTVIVASEKWDAREYYHLPGYWTGFYYKKSDDERWSVINIINNFDYKEGFEYTIRVVQVTVYPPIADYPDVEWYCLEVLRVEEKDSEGLPEN